MQFFYKKRKFGVTHFDGYEFYEWNKEDGYQSYKSINEFSHNIKIDETYVKDIWSEVSKINFAD